MAHIKQSSTKGHSKFNLNYIFTYRKYGTLKGHSMYSLVIIHQQPPQKTKFPLEKFTNFIVCCIWHLLHCFTTKSYEICTLAQLRKEINLQGQTPPATVHMLGLECVLHWSRLWLQPYWCGRLLTKHH